MTLLELSIEDQYDYIHNNIGIIQREDIGCLEISGNDTLDLLNRLSTNDLINFDYSKGSISTILTTNKGRMIDILTIVKNNSRGYFIICSLKALETVVEWINFYTIIEDVSIHDVTSKILYMTLIGPNSSHILSDESDNKINILNKIESKFIFHDSIDILINIDEKNNVINHLQNLKFDHISKQLFEIIRIKEAIPMFENEITQKFNPLEAKLDKYISFNKGCYIGQEVIARLNTYNKIKRELMNIEWDTKIAINQGEKIVFKGEDIGLITSFVYNPMEDNFIGLAYIKRNFDIKKIIAKIGVENNIKLSVKPLENILRQQ